MPNYTPKPVNKKKLQGSGTVPVNFRMSKEAMRKIDAFVERKNAEGSGGVYTRTSVVMHAIRLFLEAEGAL